MILARKIRWSESKKYGFVTGRVRALEVFLLDRAVYERLIRAEGVTEFVNLLGATRYGDFLRTAGEGDVRQALSLAAEENFNFILQYANDRWLRAILTLLKEVFNLKVMLKNRLKKGEESEKPKVKSQNAKWEVERRVAEVGAEVFLKAKERNDPAVIDLELDRFTQKMALSLTQDQDYAQGYYRLLADVTNLKTLFRLKVLGEEEVFPDAFLPSGELSLQLLLQVLRTNNYEPLKKSRFWQLVQTSVRALDRSGVIESRTPTQDAGEEEVGSFLPLERQGREMLIDYINTARFVALGYEPLFRFYLLREEELRNLRLLYVAKVAGLELEECQELVVYG